MKSHRCQTKALLALCREQPLTAFENELPTVKPLLENVKECQSQRDSGMPGPQRTRQRQPKLVQGSDLRERRDIGPKTGLAGCDARYVWGLLGVCSAVQRPEKVGAGGWE